MFFAGTRLDQVHFMHLVSRYRRFRGHEVQKLHFNCADFLCCALFVESRCMFCTWIPRKGLFVHNKVYVLHVMTKETVIREMSELKSVSFQGTMQVGADSSQESLKGWVSS